MYFAADSICVCAQWHDWKPISLAEAFRQRDEAKGKSNLLKEG